MREPVGETKRYLESPACRESLVPFVKFITSRHAARGGVTEVRILPGPGMRRGAWSGYFDQEHWRDLIEAILPLSGSPRAKIPYEDHPRITEGNVYFSVRPVDPDLLGRVANCIRYAEQSTSDADIIAYDMFPVDIDPVRKSQISATDDEKRAAHRVAQEIQSWLLEQGIKAIRADSGNGFHLLVPTIPYRGDALAGAAKDAKLLLHFLAERFDTAQAKVDLTVFNPARILRLYGTLCMKGANLAGKRPHRWSSVDLSEIPEDSDLFGKLRGLLEDYGMERQEKPTPSRAPAAASAPSDGPSWSREQAVQVLEGVLALSGLKLRRQEKGGRTLFVFEECPHHDDDDGHRYECCVMVEADGKYSASCKHDEGAHWRDFKAAIGWQRHKQNVLKSLGMWRERSADEAQPEQPPVDVDAEIAAVKEKWPAATTDKARNELLAEALGRIARGPVLERTRALGELHGVTGLKPKLLAQVLAEQMRLSKEKAKKAGPQGRLRSEDSSPGGKDDTLPWVRADDGELKSVSSQAWAALRRANQPERYFRGGGLLMRIEQDDQGSKMCRDLNLDRMRHTLARAAHFYIVRKKGDEEVVIPVPPPMDMVRDMLAEPEPLLPLLNRIVEFPVFSKDGVLQCAPGYCASSRVFYAPPPGFSLPPVPERPTKADVERAVGMITELLFDFPFTGDAERAHAVALLLLPMAREMIDGPTPLHLVEAPSPGTGKGLLTEVLAFVALGRWPAMMTEGKDEDEWRKRLTSQLMGLPSLIVIDNLRRRLDSAAFSSALTCSLWEDRVLGQSKIVRLPVRTVWVASGNNASLSHEVSRRTIRIRLDAKVDRPWLREGFRNPDLRRWAKERRPELVWSALSLVRAWLDAGRPLWQGRTLGMFDSWSRVLGGILEVAGIKGFLGNLRDLYENSDAEGAVWRGFVKAWREKFGDEEVGVSELFELANALDEPMDLGKGTEQGRKTRLGQELVKMRDRQFDELRIVLAGERRRAKKWRLVVVAAPDPRTTFTAGSSAGSPEEAVDSAAQSDGGEPGEPFSGPDTRVTDGCSRMGGDGYRMEQADTETGSSGSPRDGIELETEEESDGEPSGEPAPPAQAELNLLEGSTSGGDYE